MEEAQVLGISSPPPVAGSPLVTNEMITIYCVTFLVVLIILYAIFHYVKRPLLLAHKIKLVLVISLVLKLCFITTIGIATAFFLLPTPKVEMVTPNNSSQTVTNNPAITILFDRPVNRASMQKSITPEVPGVWTFEEPIYATHLYRKLVFHPVVTLKPDTKYVIKISNISNFLHLSPPDSYSYSFKTKPSPVVSLVTPANGAKDVLIGSSIQILLSGENNSESVFDFQFSPSFEFDKKLSRDRKSYTIIPKHKLLQGYSYQLTITKSDIQTHIPTNTVVERGNSATQYVGSFSTKESPGIVSFTPTGNKIFTDEKIRISFSQEMDRASVEKNFSISPSVSGTFIWTDDKNVEFKTTNLEFNTAYKMRIPKQTASKSGGFLISDIEKSFVTIGAVTVEKFYPDNGLKAVGINNQIKVGFDQEVNHTDAESKFAINPTTSGTFSWEGNTLVFTPTSPYKYSTDYTITIAPEIISVKGLASTQVFISNFRTQDQTVKLSVPSYLQKYSLSCEIAALRMALEFRGIPISEDKIIEHIGFDTTPKSEGIWGNPHLAFVGNINGRQMVTGYGVYWEPIARVARMFRNAEEFRGWDIKRLAKSISEKNPVIVWVYSSNGSPTGWNTTQGNPIHAVRGEHAVVAVGYVGEIDNPTSIIVNDPLLGQVQWPRLFFEKKWSAFNQSGVVVY